MPFDGFTVNSLVHELNNTILDGKVEKIYQPEKDELLFIIRKLKNNFRLLISANPSLPKFHLMEEKKDNPLIAPSFCMLLRKHLLGSKILNIKQLSLERVIEISFEGIDEMGYKVEKSLIIEIMGRHSNIIFINNGDFTIIDSIKRVSAHMSSVRTVLPGLKYVYPPSKDRIDPLDISEKLFINDIKNLSGSIMAYKYLMKRFYGISTLMAQEICFISGVEPELDLKDSRDEIILKLFSGFDAILKKVHKTDYKPNLIMENNKIIEFSSFDLNIYKSYDKTYFNSISKVVYTYYSEKDKLNRMKQKTGDLHRTVSNRLDRSVKKLEILNNELHDAEKYKEYKLLGDLIIANLYSLEKGMDTALLQNYHSSDLELIEIKMNKNLTPTENSQSYYKKYNKAKKALKLLTNQINLTKEEVIYLESVMESLDKCYDHEEIDEIKEELLQQGYLRRTNSKSKSKGKKKTHKLLHYVSSGNLDIYVGKNNMQNDYLTLKIANPRDIWFHTKDIPGSHVIVKTGNEKVDDVTISEAALLAAYHSKGKLSSNVPVDYTQKKNVKKPAGAKPGKVIYDNYKTIYITPEVELINRIKMGN